MDKIWKNRIEAGDQKLSDCPKRYIDAVIELIKKDVVDGIVTPEQYYSLTGMLY